MPRWEWGGDLDLVFCHENGDAYMSEALNWRFSKMTRSASATGTTTKADTPPSRS